MVISEALPDFYAVLQVHPDADQEVIEAAYRQLMKKHHPDVAGGDPHQAAEKHRRATEINRAFAVLRDPLERRQYDLMRQLVGTRRPPPSSGVRSAPSSHPHTVPTPAPPPAAAVQPDEVVVSSEPEALPAPLSWIASAYFLLPGTYEWERGVGRELLTIMLIPIVGSLTFALSTGRLTPLIGRSPGAGLAAALVIALLALPLLPSLPRVLMACGPGVLLLTGAANPLLAQAHTPIWLAWGAATVIALVLAPRLYVFGFVPTLLICALLART